MSVDPNNDPAPSSEGSGSVSFDQMTVAGMEYARRNGNLTPEQEQALERHYQQVTGTPLKDSHDPSKGDSLPDQFLKQEAINQGEVQDEALATVPDGEEGFGSDPSETDGAGTSYAGNGYDPLDPFDGIGDPPRAAPRGDADEYRKLPLEERLKLRAEDAKRHPERFGHRLFAGTKPPANDEEDKARIKFAHEAKAALAAGPEEVEKLLADPKNRALLDSASGTSSITSNLRQLSAEKEAKKLDPTKPAAPAPTTDKPTTPAKDAAAKRIAGSPGDKRVPQKRAGTPRIHSLVMLRETPEPKPIPKPANDQDAGATVKPSAQAKPPQQKARATPHNSGFGLGKGPAGTNGPSFPNGGMG